MRLLGVASLLAVAGALAAPTAVHAADHVSLSVGPIALKGKLGWTLTAFAPSMGPSDEEILGVTLRRTFRNGTAEEVHGLRQTLATTRTITFDGSRGTWRTQGLLGDVLTINMTATPSGPAREVDADFRLCRGDFVEVPVLLRGSFVLRTRTRYFGTIRRAQLRGLVRYNRSGTIDCAAGFQPPTTCSGWTRFWAENANEDDAVNVYGDATGTRLQLAFREPVGRTGPVWYHWMSVETSEPFAGRLPTLALRAPASSPISGNGTFTATQTSESTSYACRVTKVDGVFVGTFRTRFTGWGVRRLVLSTSNASHVVGR